MMIDSAAASKFLATTRFQAEHFDPNDLLYSLDSSFSYDCEPALLTIKARLLALNFSGDEFNPDTLRVLARLVPTLQRGRYVVQRGTPTTPRRHFATTRCELWAQYVGEFVRWLGSVMLKVSGVGSPRLIADSPGS